MPGRIDSWLHEDPWLARMYRDVRASGPIRSISVDLTHACNIRCTGCYYFAEGMDRHAAPRGLDGVHALSRASARAAPTS